MIRIVALVSAVLLGACAPGGETTTQATTAATTTTVPVTTVPAPSIPPQLEGWDTRAIHVALPGVDSDPLVVAVADDPAERERGLMGVSDLLDLDGVLFVFESDTDSGFWMKDTLIGLDIAFFAVDGALVDRMTMEPCTADPCPVHRPDGPYRFALEVPAGDLAALTGAEVLVLAE